MGGGRAGDRKGRVEGSEEGRSIGGACRGVHTQPFHILPSLGRGPRLSFPIRPLRIESADEHGWLLAQPALLAHRGEEAEGAGKGEGHENGGDLPRSQSCVDRGEQTDLQLGHRVLTDEETVET